MGEKDEKMGERRKERKESLRYVRYLVRVFSTHIIMAMSESLYIYRKKANQTKPQNPTKNTQLMGQEGRKSLEKEKKKCSRIQQIYFILFFP